MQNAFPTVQCCSANQADSSLVPLQTHLRRFALHQVCIDARPMHCSTGHGRIALPLFSAAQQNRLTACLCQCNYTYGDLLFIQVWIDARPMHSSTGQGRIASPLFSAALQNRLTACLCQCNYTYGDLLFIQVCIDARPMHSSTGQGRIAEQQSKVARNKKALCSTQRTRHSESQLWPMLFR